MFSDANASTSSVSQPRSTMHETPESITSPTTEIPFDTSAECAAVQDMIQEELVQYSLEATKQMDTEENTAGNTVKNTVKDTDNRTKQSNIQNTSGSLDMEVESYSDIGQDSFEKESSKSASQKKSPENHISEKSHPKGKGIKGVKAKNRHRKEEDSHKQAEMDISLNSPSVQSLETGSPTCLTAKHRQTTSLDTSLKSHAVSSGSKSQGSRLSNTSKDTARGTKSKAVIAESEAKSNTSTWDSGRTVANVRETPSKRIKTRTSLIDSGAKLPASSRRSIVTTDSSKSSADSGTKPKGKLDLTSAIMNIVSGNMNTGARGDNTSHPEACNRHTVTAEIHNIPGPSGDGKSRSVIGTLPEKSDINTKPRKLRTSQHNLDTIERETDSAAHRSKVTDKNTKKTKGQSESLSQGYSLRRADAQLDTNQNPDDSEDDPDFSKTEPARGKMGNVRKKSDVSKSSVKFKETDSSKHKEGSIKTAQKVAKTNKTAAKETEKSYSREETDVTEVRSKQGSEKSAGKSQKNVHALSKELKSLDLETEPPTRMKEKSALLKELKNLGVETAAGSSRSTRAREKEKISPRSDTESSQRYKRLEEKADVRKEPKHLGTGTVPERSQRSKRALEKTEILKGVETDTKSSQRSRHAEEKGALVKELRKLGVDMDIETNLESSQLPKRAEQEKAAMLKELKRLGIKTDVESSRSTRAKEKEKISPRTRQAKDSERLKSPESSHRSTRMQTPPRTIRSRRFSKDSDSSRSPASTSRAHQNTKDSPQSSRHSLRSAHTVEPMDIDEPR